MADDINPYYTWLGIPLAEQPPNHYRLLGLATFEADEHVIAHSADRHMSYVRTLKTGPHAATAQTILNEMTAAKRCLLNAAERAEYDAKLRAALPHDLSSAPAPVQTAPAQTAPAPSAPILPAPVDVAPVQVVPVQSVPAVVRPVPSFLKSAAPRPPQAPARTAGPPRLKSPVSRRPPAAPEESAEGYEILPPLGESANLGESLGAEVSLVDLAEIPPPRARALAARGPRYASPRPVKLVIGLVGVATLLAAVLYFRSGGPPEDAGMDHDVGTNAAGPISQPSNGASKAPGIGLAPPVSPAPPNPVPGFRHSVDVLAALADSGQKLVPGWHWEGKTLVSEASGDPQFQPLPAVLPLSEEYDVELVAERVAGNFAADGCLAVNVPRDDSSYDLLIDFDGYRTAAGRFEGENGTTARIGSGMGPLLRMGVACRHHFQLARDMVFIDHAAGFSLKGTLKGLLNVAPKNPRPPHQLAIGSTQAFRVSKLELRPFGEHVSAPDRAGSPVHTPQSDSENLLRLIDPKQDAICGEWKFEGTDLVSVGFALQWRAIEIPVRPTDPYKVILKFTCGPDDRPFVVLGLIRNGRSGRELFTAGIDPGGPLAGFWSRTKSMQADLRIAPDEKTFTVICTVQPQEVRLECNGQLFEVWSATQTAGKSKEPRSLGLNPRSIRDRLDRLFLNCRGARFTVHELTFERIKP